MTSLSVGEQRKRTPSRSVQRRPDSNSRRRPELPPGQGVCICETRPVIQFTPRVPVWTSRASLVLWSAC